ncbi:MAG TPA: hypothetical protein VFK48_15315 [Usitatibacter sp.]|nr:hypothetical protein [Usitatibacter sp.]
MPRLAAFILLALTSMAAIAAPRTVCTITVNSADEKDAMRARLPAGEYRFVELVEKGRPDWLRSSCQRKVQCDVLVVSGHFNAGEDFYSDQLEKDEYLRVDELERASCSDSCPGLFSKLKEVYLFGCDSLKPVGDGDGGESSRERMRRIFAGVPNIYGFSSAAPVGPTAAMLLNRYFDRGGGALGNPRPNARMLEIFRRNSMTHTAGLGPADARAEYRRQVCTFYDERLDAARKLRHVHALMRRDIRQAAHFVPRIEKLLESVPAAEREAPALSQALAEISADDASRDGFVAIARQSAPARRARMVALAGHLGWLAPEAQHAENVALVNDLLARPRMEFGDVDLVCSLSARGALADALERIRRPAAARVAHSAALACLGDVEAQGRVVRALAASDVADVQIAQLYLRHRPMTDARSLRAMARDITRMPASSAKVRALDTLGRHGISDRELLEDLALAFAQSRSLDEQRAIAEIFIRSDPRALPRRQVAAAMREHRLRAPDGREDLIDVVLRRLEASSS